MKRNIHIITIAAIIITVLSVFIKKENNHLNVFQSREKRPAENILQIDSTNQNLNIYNSTLNCENKNSQVLYYDEKNHTGKIGVTDSTLFDNPKDNVFNINIDNEISANTRVFLEYDLYGLQDYNSVCRGINENISIGGVIVKKSNIWSSQSE